ncbi:MULTISPECIES: glycosyltransferase family 4 protein [unclassified Duganella]|uniref:glycosyltransferase family 4 protein n=1 Tax=unclassified Duganella TaxID=2636909 RepID=UPI00087E082F|nr:MULTISPECIES: glycosyltransferase family 4 protein [unclassified Duganella]SDH20218.1 Glycosyltransferase involved in cell wall bisynthesis [Duganella sp. OV458]SDK34211.1 Glycosyltransferase involved in cell wall bisynthesis [Duganella sp. OV510]
MRKYLFIHQNFPGQFKHLAPALAAQGHEVVGLGMNQLTLPLPGVRYIRHDARATPQGPRAPSQLKDLYSKVLRGESAATQLAALKQQGFAPDVVFVHPGWGEALFVKDVFPKARLLIYAEYYYSGEGGDAFFDPEFSQHSLEGLQRLRLRNTHLLHAMSVADAALSPTTFQRDRHPAWFRDRISVIHDGIDTQRFRPDPRAYVQLQAAGLTLRPGDEVVVFVARQLEPYRGYHIFMRALPELMRQRPNARVVIVGGDGVSYGAAPPAGKSWKQIFLDEVKDQLDMRRIHFVGKVPHATLTQLMQVAAVYTYLTYPFVLSWSLMEAMSCGCLIVASKTAPVEEVITHGHNGLLTDFFDPQALAATVADALARRADLQHLRDAARQTIIERYDMQRCMPALLRFVQPEA